MPTFLIIAVATLLAATLPVRAVAQRPIKVYISADMEGVAGVVSPEQLGPAGFEYQRFREFMTAEVLAAIEGAREGGATEVLVSDSHGNGLNLLIERMPADVRVVRSWPRPLGMMEGIDSSFAAVIFVGYHSGTTNAAGVRAHTLSSANYAGLALNGVQMPEAGLNAAIAGYFGVPVVLISGDDVAVDEARRLIGELEAVAVKRAISFHAASTLTPAASQALIKERARAAMARRSNVRPYRLATPVRLDLTFKNYRPAEVLAYLPIVQRTDAHSVRYTARNVLEVSRFLQFVGGYEPGLTP